MSIIFSRRHFEKKTDRRKHSTTPENERKLGLTELKLNSICRCYQHLPSLKGILHPFETIVCSDKAEP